MIFGYGGLGRAEQRRRHIDWFLIGAVAGLLVLGTLAIFSAAVPLPYHAQIIHRHFLGIGLGVIVFLIGMWLPYQIYDEQWKILYAISVALLIGVLISGEMLRGTRGWFKLPFFSFQPSEVARVCMILCLSAFLNRRAHKIKTLGAIVYAIGLVLPVLFLILKEPDLSSTLVLFPAITAVLFCAGAHGLYLGFLLGCGLLSFLLTVAWTFFSIRTDWLESSALIRFFMELSHLNVTLVITCVGIVVFFFVAWWVCARLGIPIPAVYFVALATIILVGLMAGNIMESQIKGYQRSRLVTFLDPAVDPRGAGYNLLQARIAIGSGGVTGKGIFSGTQSQLGFVPERHTDFILAVVGEEMGLLGTLAVLGLYLLLLGRIFNAARVAQDRFGYLVACGIGAMFACYLFINAGMSVGIVPVAGVPLPFVSYGGSNLVMSLWSVGIVESIHSRRYTIA
ncbi:MAG: rod shape-determining protein RodA [Elusimicrobia bacterium]|nr:rod shape-determining protein RodA [Elusimicrobiota bacterium]